MGRHGKDSSTLLHSSSSIQLLQKRFKQLQRIREKRQKRELLKLFSGAEFPGSALSPSRPLTRNSNLQVHEEAGEFPAMPASLPSSPPPRTTDVDTSLHL
ncbi:hypothetical protein KSP39_PZI021309 [Platanthera zijinensis]|uniref:Uncharacterized protein n=1 Tax=Platanthera zijinensis TaxID=2320716 RepID=A0AAP0AYB4_9ASPA